MRKLLANPGYDPLNGKGRPNMASGFDQDCQSPSTQCLSVYLQFGCLDFVEVPLCDCEIQESPNGRLLSRSSQTLDFDRFGSHT